MTGKASALISEYALICDMHLITCEYSMSVTLRNGNHAHCTLALAIRVGECAGLAVTIIAICHRWEHQPLRLEFAQK